MTTRGLVALWQTFAVLGAVGTTLYISRRRRERRTLYWAVLAAWAVTFFPWDWAINTVAHVEYSDHWPMLFTIANKADPVVAPFIYVLWFVLPAVFVLEHRERLEAALGPRSFGWLWLGFVLWSFYLDFAATSFRPAWTYYQRSPMVLEYPVLAPVVNGFLTGGAYFVFRRIDEARRRRGMSGLGLLGRAWVATNGVYAGLFTFVVLAQRLPGLDGRLLPYVKSQ
jgi:hypothetical protein